MIIAIIIVGWVAIMSLTLLVVCAICASAKDPDEPTPEAGTVVELPRRFRVVEDEDVPEPVWPAPRSPFDWDRGSAA